MSRFAALKLGDGRCYHTDATSAEVANWTAGLGASWVVGVIEGGDARDKASLLDAMAEALAFPAYFGRNWDALVDCIDELGWRDADTLVVFNASEQVLADDTSQAGTLAEVLLEAFEDCDGGRLKVLLQGGRGPLSTALSAAGATAEPL